MEINGIFFVQKKLMRFINLLYHTQIPYDIKNM